jgi:hypothetical protein
MQILLFFQANPNDVCERTVWIWKTVSMSDHDVWGYASDVSNEEMATLHGRGPGVVSVIESANAHASVSSVVSPATTKYWTAIDGRASSRERRGS